ncbi:lysine decarboxylase [Pseudolabrys sp. Root1462]|uniref:LOG family protein n=1 Tax=Pseudolabrys sp. Root1462 TaxID=1736466 RepID=UPI00070308D3|nr:TIGR00730 family Rossman fold protein [Pseudolabrys sp. Root1462]KQZ01389.1 lysine decarboxylase [Pseudolabrys sp. Root1462]
MNAPQKTATIGKICVYCGSGPGTDPAFVEAATALGTAMAKAGIGLVYGGGDMGMMGAVAEAVRRNGGAVTGIIPEFLLNKERAGFNGDGLIVTRDMHERKRKMFEMADAFVAMPGGIGTLEEIVEQMTWAQLGRHKKPILLANIKGFWDPLSALLNHMKALAFIRDGMEFEMLVADKVDDIIPQLQRAAQSVPAAAKDMPAAVAEKL